MYTYSFSEDETEKLKTKSSKSQDILKKLQDIDSKYNIVNSSLQHEDSPTYQRMTYEKPSAEDLTRQAEDSLYEYKASNIDKIKSEAETGKQSIKKQEEALAESKTNQMANLTSAYSSVKENAENDAIARGLARSSIIVNKLAKFDQSMLQEFAKIENDYNKSMTEFSAKKELLENEKQSALHSFDIAYAVKLQSKIDDLNNEIQTKEQEVIKYNNQMTEKEAEYQKEIEELIAKELENSNQNAIDYQKLMSEYGINFIETAKTREKYNAILGALTNMTKEEALDEVTNNTDIKEHLSTDYYNRLLKEINSRKD